MILPLEQITAENAEEQITERITLMNQMVGQLYPQILWDEVRKLRELYPRGRRPARNTPTPP